MSLFLKALVALLVGVFVAFVVGKICLHYNIDQFWGFIAGVIAGIAYFVRGPEI